MKNITSGTEWRKMREQGEVVELPSGNTARLRPVALSELIHLGRIPNQLFEFSYALMSGEFEATDSPEQRLEQLRQYSQLSEIICKAAFLEPKIVDEPEADSEITFFDLDENDASFVVAWARSPQLTLENFREAEAEPVDSL